MLQAVRVLTEMARTSDDRSRAGGSNSDGQASTSTGGAVAEPVLFREIHKNGWLRRTDTKFEKDTSRFWVTFCIHDDVEPLLEAFIDKKQSTTHSPIWTQSLRNALHLSPTLCATSRNDYEFCVNFTDNGILRLAAPTYQAMLGWVQLVTRKLTEMKILSPKENLYSKGPERIATRDPTSPLPPPPISNSAQRLHANSSSPSTSRNSPVIFTFDDISIDERRTRLSPAVVQRPPMPLPSPRVETVAVSNENSPGISSYESIFLASSHSPNEEIRAGTNRSPSVSSNSEREQYAALMEYRSSDSPDVGSRGRPPRTMLTLRQQQVSKLKNEMSHPAGVRLRLGRRDCKDCIAFVDCFDAVWIAGWKHREHPLLYNVLHIGDLVLSVAGISPSGASAVKEILRNYTSPRVEMVVKRLPHARVMTLTRTTESEDFGVEVCGNDVLRFAPEAGVPATTNPADPAAEPESRVNWSLTEVNNKPLNIIDGNAHERLNAVGRDVSIVLQPSDLVACLRKKLRAMRSYKSFILQ